MQNLYIRTLLNFILKKKNLPEIFTKPMYISLMVAVEKGILIFFYESYCKVEL